MKLLYFDDFKLGVLKGDNVVDVSAVVEDIPHSGPGDLMNGLIARFDEYRSKLEDARRGRPGRSRAIGAHSPPAAQAYQHRLHGRELHGERHAACSGAD